MVSDSAVPPAPHHRVGQAAYLLFSVAGLSVAFVGIYFVTHRPLPEKVAAGGPWQFLTNLSLALTAVSISTNIVASVVPNKVTRFASAVLAAAALVAETLVALIYWTLKLLFLELIVHEGIAKKDFIPLWLDFTIHLFPITFLSIDYYVMRRVGFGLPLALVLALVPALAVAYWCVVETLVKPPAHYPYPFLNVEREERLKIFAAVAMSGVVFYHVYEYLHKVVERVVFSTKTKAE